jgi:hypothetical protein
MTDDEIARRAESCRLELERNGWFGWSAPAADAVIARHVRYAAEDALAQEIDAAPHPTGEDGMERLCRAVYGRPAQPRDYLGGSEARMLRDGADLIADLRAKLEAAYARIAGQSDALSRAAEKGGGNG